MSSTRRSHLRVQKAADLLENLQGSSNRGYKSKRRGDRGKAKQFSDRKTKRILHQFEVAELREDKIEMLNKLLIRVYSQLEAKDTHYTSISRILVSRKYGDRVPTTSTTSASSTTTILPNSWANLFHGGTDSTITYATATPPLNMYEFRLPQLTRQEQYDEERMEIENSPSFLTRVLTGKTARHLISHEDEEIVEESYNDGTIDTYRVRTKTKKLSPRDLMNKNQILLDGMQQRYDPKLIPFVFVGVTLATSTDSKKSGLPRDYVSPRIELMQGLFSASEDNGGISNTNLNTASIAELADDSKIDLSKLGLIGTLRLRAFTFPSEVSSAQIHTDSMGIGTIPHHNDTATDIEKYLPLRPVSAETRGMPFPDFSNHLVDTLRSVCHGYSTPSRTRQLGLSGHKMIGSHSASNVANTRYVRRSSGLGLDTLSSVDRRDEYVDTFMEAYLGYLNTALAIIPFRKDVSISFQRLAKKDSSRDGIHIISINMRVRVKVDGSIGVSPAVIPRESYLELHSILKSLRHTGAHNGNPSIKEQEVLPNRKFSCLEAGAPSCLSSRALIPLSRSFEFSTTLYQTETKFRDHHEYHIDPSYVLRKLNENTLAEMTYPISRMADGVVNEMVSEFMGNVGDKILSLYFNDTQEGTLRNNFMAAVEAYKNRFFLDGPYENLTEFSEKIGKQLNTCYLRMESVIEKIKLDVQSRDKTMNIISLLPEVASPSYIDERFAKRKNHLVFKTSTGQLAYYSLKLEMGVGAKACHKISKFPTVFSDGIVVASDGTFYKVTAEDLIRGRILRTCEITLEQVLGEFNHGTTSPRNLASGGVASSSEHARDGGGIQPESPYQEFGFSEDIGDEESQLIDLAMQNQVYSL